MSASQGFLRVSRLKVWKHVGSTAVGSRGQHSTAGACGGAEPIAATRVESCCLHVSHKCEKPLQVAALRQSRLTAWSTRDFNAASIRLPPLAPASTAGLAQWGSLLLCAKSLLVFLIASVTHPQAGHSPLWKEEGRKKPSFS